MGVLDELKQEVEDLKAKEGTSRETTQADAELVRRKLAPKMQALYNYFKQFNEHLQVVSPDVTGDYVLEAVGSIMSQPFWASSI